MPPSARTPVIRNRRARFDYEIIDTFEAGLALLGPEVKSLRAGRANLGDAHGILRRGELYLVNAYIAPYEQAGRENPDPRRDRKLLLHGYELARLQGRVAERGLTLIPMSIYFNQAGRAKVELALARGRRKYDKRQAIRRREEERELRRATQREGGAGA